jgi:hypothetical protein
VSFGFAVVVVLTAITPLSALAMFACLTIGTSVASDAVFEVTDTLFLMLGANVGWRVLVAAVARVALELVVGVADRASSVVLTVEHKPAIVLKSGRFPALRAMTLHAGARDLAVETVRWRSVAALTTLQFRRGKHGVIESGWRPMLGRVALIAAHNELAMQIISGSHVAGLAALSHDWAQGGMREMVSGQLPVIAMARHAVGFRQLPVERSSPAPSVSLRDRGSARATDANVRQGVAGNAAFGSGPAKRCMADEALRCELSVRRHEWARTQHGTRIDESERNQHEQVACDDNPDPRPFHFQLQKRNTAMM